MSLQMYNPFLGYGYNDDVPFKSSVVTADSVNKAIEDAMGTITIEDGELKVGDTTLGTVEAGSIIDGMDVDDDNNLVIKYHTESNENEQEIIVPLEKFVDVYTGGVGITVDDKTISINDADVATQTELDEVKDDLASNYLTKSDAEETYAQTSALEDYLTKEDAESIYATQTDLEAYLRIVDAEETYATKEEIPSLDGYLTETTAAATYQPIGDYVTEETAEETYQPKGEYVSSVELSETDNNVFTLEVDGEAKGGFTLPATDGLATTEELDTVKTNLESEITALSNSALTKEEAAETYQPKGEYVSSVELTETDNNVFTLQVDGEDKGGFTLPSIDDMATKEEVNSVSANVENNTAEIAALQAMVDILTARLDAISQSNVVPVDLSNAIGDLTDLTADYVLSGELTSTLSVTGKSIILDDTVVVANDNRLFLKANDVTIEGSTISGEYVKANGNSVIKIDECENVVITNLKFDDTFSGYNGIEIGLTQGSTKYPKNILVDGCEIGGTFSNNAINVYATDNDATVTISNCHFVNVSNCLRISNTTKASGVTFDIVNCTVDEWEHKENNEAYYGFFIGQDYTSSTEEEEIENNLFGKDKITLNFTNLVHAGEKVCPSDPYSVCGVDDGTQVVYTYANKHGKWYYETNPEMYPVVTFE